MEQTWQRLLHAANRGFHASEYGGLGVDAVATDAGVTSGTFYKHFGSKAEAFHEVLRAGLQDLRESIEAALARHGRFCLIRHTEWYMSAPEGPISPTHVRYRR